MHTPDSWSRSLRWLTLAACLPAAAVPAASDWLRPADLIYRGAFALPGDAWAYGGHALTFYPDGDPGGAGDGYPGSLYAAGNAADDGTHDLVGELSIPAPLIARDLEALPVATELRPQADITGGWIRNCTYDPECEYRNVDGLAYLPNVNKIAWNLRDWYNAARIDQDSLGWSDLDLSGAVGVWHIGPRREDELFHNAKTSDYLFMAPDTFAASHLGGYSLIAGSHREAGALGGSQGPALVATAPWHAGNPPASGTELDARALLYYRESYACVWIAENQIQPTPAAGVCDFPDYRAADQWEGGAWIEAGERRATLIFGRKALGPNCYDTETVCADTCPHMMGKGYHAYPYAPRVLFYAPTDLAATASGARDPWTVLPYASIDVSAVTFGGSDCALLGAAAYDATRQRLFVAEETAGPMGETVIHVWDVAQRPARDSAWLVAEIYVATMGYAPDDEGLQYWIDNLDNPALGWTPATVAQSFFDQTLVQERYPAGQPTDDFIQALYRNIFNRDADAEGQAYWLAELDAGRVGRNQMIVTLIEGGWDNPAAAPDMARFGNQIEVALAFAAGQAERGILYNQLRPDQQQALRAAGSEILADVSADTSTRDAAIARIPELLAPFSTS